MRPLVLIAAVAVAAVFCLVLLQCAEPVIKSLQESTALVRTMGPEFPGLPEIKYRLVVGWAGRTLLAGDAVAPHLYDWRFDGADDCVVFSGYPYGGYNWTAVETVVIRYMDTSYSTWCKVVSHYWGANLTNVRIGEGGSNDYYLQASAGLGYAQDIGFFSNIGNPFGFNSWGELAWSVNITAHKLWVFFTDGRIWTPTFVAGPRDGWILGGFDAVAIGKADYWAGKVSYVIAYRALNATSPFTRIVSRENMLYFLDPTFWNGTHYIDLVSGAIGTPYGGVRRVEAESKWVWVIRGWAGDSYVHVLVPPGYAVLLKDSSGRTRVLGNSIVTDGREVYPYKEYKVEPGTYEVAVAVPYVDDPTNGMGFVARAGDAVVFHIWDWYFDGGANPQVVFAGYPFPQDDAFTAFTVIIRFKDTEFTTWRKLAVFVIDGLGVGLGAFGEGGDNDYYAQVSNGSISIQSIGYDANLGNPETWPNPDSFHTVAWSYAVGGVIHGYADFKAVPAAGIKAGPAYGDRIGGFDRIEVARSWAGYISFIILSNRTDNVGIVYGQRVISDVIVFIDPTYNNGTHYFDVATGIAGEVVGGTVKLVEAEGKFATVIRGMFNDSYVHVLVPPGVAIAVRGATWAGILYNDGSDGEPVRYPYREYRLSPGAYVWNVYAAPGVAGCPPRVAPDLVRLIRALTPWIPAVVGAALALLAVAAYTRRR